MWPFKKKQIDPKLQLASDLANNVAKLRNELSNEIRKILNEPPLEFTVTNHTSLQSALADTKRHVHQININRILLQNGIKPVESLDNMFSDDHIVNTIKRLHSKAVNPELWK
jgi:hypothetical protein